MYDECAAGETAYGSTSFCTEDPEALTVTGVLGEFTTVSSAKALPDKGILQAIGLHHDLNSAVADLVDNSIDAQAADIRIRFVTRRGLVVNLLVIDNGTGMSSTELDEAMRLARPKTDSAHALGHFGIGLKAASFSQAGALTVLSKPRDGNASGRRMFRDSRDGDFEVGKIDDRESQEVFETLWSEIAAPSGTIVRWDELRTFPVASDPRVTSDWLEDAIASLRHHLGIVFHRILVKSNCSMVIDVYQTESGVTGIPFSVEPVDPFSYGRSGAAGFPKTFTAAYANGRLPLQCHVWPPRSDAAAFRLWDTHVDLHQGFYLYRNDRLLSAGGWNGVTNEVRQLRLARVAVDIDDHLDQFTMTSEKAGVRMGPDLVRAIEDAGAHDGSTFRDYLSTAEHVFRAGNKRQMRRPTVLPPGQGLSPRVKRAIEREFDVFEDREPLRIRWRSFETEEFLEVDRRTNTLWLNDDYRTAVLRGRHGGVNDAPLVKALLYLLFEDVFRGTFYGSRDKDNVTIWREIITAAADEELGDSGE